MDNSLRQTVDDAFNEFIEDFTTSCADIDKDILNYSSKYFDDQYAQQLFCMEVGLQLIVYQLGKYLAVFEPMEQYAMIDRIENTLRKHAVSMHKKWLKHREKYQGSHEGEGA